MNRIDNFLFNLFQRLGWLKVFNNFNNLKALSLELSMNLFNLLTSLKPKKVALIWIREGGKATFEDFLTNSDWLKNFPVVLHSSIKISSYREESKSGNLEFTGLSLNEEEKINGADVVMIDDLIESGLTSQGAEEYFKKLGAKNVIFCFSFNKETGKRAWTPKYFLFGQEIKTKLFLVGYGLDFYEELRQLRLVFGLRPLIFKILGRWPFKRWFISLIKKHDKMMSDSFA